MSSPVLSVLMPVYNADRYLVQAVESILQQTFSDFELLIVDDGSTDHSPRILRRYAEIDARIRLISRPNTGYVVALNEMLRLAQGKFIARMDADDIAKPERFSHQLEFLHQHPHVVCVGGCHDLIDHRGRFLTYLPLPLSNDEIQREALAGHGSICHPCAMMRRSALLQIGGYDETMMPAEDLDLWLKLGEIGELANLDRSVLQYRLHPHSVSETSCTIQRQKAHLACQKAWKRRGVEGQFEAGEPWRPGADRDSRHRFMIQYGWWAFNSRQRQTAMIYSTKAIWANPLEREGWALLAAALLKLPQPPES
jgi:glycosyltransferase involved in cell wall biosynthesis